MTYVMGQATCPTGSVNSLFTVPPGLCNVTFWNVSAPTVYVGTSTAVTSLNGLTCHSIPTSFFSYVSSRGTTFYGTASSSGALVNYVIVTDQG